MHLGRLLRLPPTARRAGWNLLDQVISAGTNAALSFIVANSVDETSFGGFAVAFTVFSLAIGLSRAFSTSPLAIRFSDVPEGDYRAAAGAAVGTAVTMGLIGSVLALVGAALVDGVAGQSLLALAVVLPGLLAQDAWRYVFIAAGRPAAAVVNDGAWAVVQIAAVVALVTAGASSVALLIVAWGVSAAAAALLGVRQGRSWPHVRRARSWLRDHRDLTGYVAAEFATLQFLQQGALLVIATIGSLATIGALRGAQVLLGPVAILAVAAFGFAVPELSRQRRRFNRRQWLVWSGSMSLVVALLGLTWGLFFLLAPDVVGETLLGSTWPGTQTVLVPGIVQSFSAALGVGFASALYAMDRAPLTMIVHVPQATLMFLLGVGGAVLHGAQGAAWGFAAAFTVVLPIWGFLVVREAGRTVERFAREAAEESAESA
ncbi:Membrane protein involved in the export of O-antigen and teichoic acid [Nocardioides scoriae]|uniref:Membrane protein involved in the export of O-antigen and teichoic acid n=1 Tax=Nocardioides scoriae TaxID=642780 RepID=A0A1H1UY87_9ACTN|nr:hypothetical protein [Nocardioides scoriae]SDS77548.1 Membrane protein involved in the export of O-antigen and teichoic acid [Nocardioides scoriae]